MNKLWICIYFLAISCHAITISGKITDAATNEPISHVNVYLANTMMGDVSDHYGLYEIKAKPGNYNLIVSHLGYKPVVQNVHLTMKNSVLNFRLTAQAIEMPEVTVNAKEMRIFKRRLRTFQTLFLGSTDNAKQCHIKNPEFLQFAEKAGYLIAVCDVPLKIHNAALGYDINIVMQKFKWMKTNMGGSYITHPQFIDLCDSVDQQQAEKWCKARQQTFTGSPRQFFSNIFHHENTGEFSYSWKNIEDERYGMPTRECSYFQIDTLQVLNYRRLSIEHDYVKIHGANRRVTTLKMKSNYLMIDRYGLVINYDAYSLSGYWGTLRMADTLPQDYIPNEL